MRAAYERAVAVVAGRGDRDAIHFRSGSEIQSRFFSPQSLEIWKWRSRPMNLKSSRCAASNDFLPARRDETRRDGSAPELPRSRFHEGRTTKSHARANPDSLASLFATGCSILLPYHIPHFLPIRKCGFATEDT